MKFSGGIVISGVYIALYGSIWPPAYLELGISLYLLLITI